jgi:hypothetical protein
VSALKYGELSNAALAILKHALDADATKPNDAKGPKVYEGRRGDRNFGRVASKLEARGYVVAFREMYGHKITRVALTTDGRKLAATILWENGYGWTMRGPIKETP